MPTRNYYFYNPHRGFWLASSGSNFASFHPNIHITPCKVLYGQKSWGDCWVAQIWFFVHCMQPLLHYKHLGKLRQASWQSCVQLWYSLVVLDSKTYKRAGMPASDDYFQYMKHLIASVQTSFVKASFKPAFKFPHPSYWHFVRRGAFVQIRLWPPRTAAVTATVLFDKKP